MVLSFLLAKITARLCCLLTLLGTFEPNIELLPEPGDSYQRVCSYDLSLDEDLD